MLKKFRFGAASKTTIPKFTPKAHFHEKIRQKKYSDGFFYTFFSLFLCIFKYSAHNTSLPSIFYQKAIPCTKESRLAKQASFLWRRWRDSNSRGLLRPYRISREIMREECSYSFSNCDAKYQIEQHFQQILYNITLHRSKTL